jgi:hypothetical protein
MITWKGYGKNWSWLDLKYYTSIYLEKERKIMKTPVMTSGLEAKIHTGDLKYEATVLTTHLQCSVLTKVL